MGGCKLAGSKGAEAKSRRSCACPSCEQLGGKPSNKPINGTSAIKSRSRPDRSKKKELNPYGGNKGDESKSHRDYMTKKAAAPKKKDWIKSVDAHMEKRGTEGIFSRAAKRKGMSVHDYAMMVVKDLKGKSGLTASQKTLLRRAVLALNYQKIAKK